MQDVPEPQQILQLESTTTPEPSVHISPEILEEDALAPIRIVLGQAEGNATPSAVFHARELTRMSTRLAEIWAEQTGQPSGPPPRISVSSKVWKLTVIAIE